MGAFAKLLALDLIMEQVSGQLYAPVSPMVVGFKTGQFNFFLRENSMSLERSSLVTLNNIIVIGVITMFLLKKMISVYKIHF
jgi:lipid A disaccharide synthetase